MRTIGSSLILARLHSVCSDTASLVQFSEGLVSRAQLLQDAAVGIISSDQNDVMKVLTIASVVGIPPVLVAGVYGMNFKNISEYDWAWGLSVGLGVDCDFGATAVDLVQVEGLDLRTAQGHSCALGCERSATGG